MGCRLNFHAPCLIVAQKDGRFKSEIAPVSVKTRKVVEEVSVGITLSFLSHFR